jgi:transposase-like protein
VDQDGHVLDILVQRRRDKYAANKFFRKLLKGRCQINVPFPTAVLCDILAA